MTTFAPRFDRNSAVRVPPTASADSRQPEPRPSGRLPKRAGPPAKPNEVPPRRIHTIRVRELFG